jgi:hypothetical protein
MGGTIYRLINIIGCGNIIGFNYKYLVFTNIYNKKQYEL